MKNLHTACQVKKALRQNKTQAFLVMNRFRSTEKQKK
jgi:hypothetical protein